MHFYVAFYVEFDRVSQEVYMFVIKVILIVTCYYGLRMAWGLRHKDTFKFCF